MADLKKRIAKRTAKEFYDGCVANLGIGLPTMAANYIQDGIHVILHSENGFVGLGPEASEKKMSVDVINSGGVYVQYTPEANFFDTATSFGIARGGHIDITVLGAMEVDEGGNLANWLIPDKMVAGMGGAMDLVTGAKKVIISMLHTQKGKPKILEKCTLPCTALGVVKMIITEMAVMEVTADGILVKEIHSDYSRDDVQKATGCKLLWSEDLRIYE